MEKLYTVKDIANAVSRDRHTAWRYVRKYGYDKRLISGNYLLTEKEFNEIVKKILEKNFSS